MPHLQKAFCLPSSFPSRFFYISLYLNLYKTSSTFTGKIIKNIVNKNAGRRIRTSGPVSPGQLLSGEPQSPTLPCLPNAPGWIWTNNVHHIGHGFTDRLLQPFAYRCLIKIIDHKIQYRNWAGQDSNLRCFWCKGFTVPRRRRWTTRPCFHEFIIDYDAVQICTILLFFYCCKKIGSVT